MKFQRHIFKIIFLGWCATQGQFSATSLITTAPGGDPTKGYESTTETFSNGDTIRGQVIFKDGISLSSFGAAATHWDADGVVNGMLDTAVFTNYLNLKTDLHLGPMASFASGGMSFRGNHRTVFFDGDFTMPSAGQCSLSGTSAITFDGQGNTLAVVHAPAFVGFGESSSLKFSQINFCNMTIALNSSINSANVTGLFNNISQITFENTRIVQNGIGDLIYSNDATIVYSGSSYGGNPQNIVIQGDVYFDGKPGSVMDFNGSAFTINKNSTLHVGPGVVFTNIGSIAMADQTSVLHLNGCDFYTDSYAAALSMGSTAAGLTLKSGTVIFENQVRIFNTYRTINTTGDINTELNNGLVFGDNYYPGNGVNVRMLAGAYVLVNGCMDYQLGQGNGSIVIDNPGTRSGGAPSFGVDFPSRPEFTFNLPDGTQIETSSTSYGNVDEVFGSFDWSDVNTIYQLDESGGHVTYPVTAHLSTFGKALTDINFEVEFSEAISPLGYILGNYGVSNESYLAENIIFPRPIMLDDIAVTFDVGARQNYDPGINSGGGGGFSGGGSSSGSGRITVTGGDTGTDYEGGMSISPEITVYDPSGGSLYDKKISFPVNVSFNDIVTAAGGLLHAGDSCWVDLGETTINNNDSTDPETESFHIWGLIKNTGTSDPSFAYSWETVLGDSSTESIDSELGGNISPLGMTDPYDGTGVTESFVVNTNLDSLPTKGVGRVVIDSATSVSSSFDLTKMMLSGTPDDVIIGPEILVFDTDETTKILDDSATAYFNFSSAYVMEAENQIFGSGIPSSGDYVYLDLGSVTVESNDLNFGGAGETVGADVYVKITNDGTATAPSIGYTWQVVSDATGADTPIESQSGTIDALPMTAPYVGRVSSPPSVSCLQSTPPGFTPRSTGPGSITVSGISSSSISVQAEDNFGVTPVLVISDSASNVLQESLATSGESDFTVYVTADDIYNLSSTGNSIYIQAGHIAVESNDFLHPESEAVDVWVKLTSVDSEEDTICCDWQIVAGNGNDDNPSTTITMTNPYDFLGYDGSGSPLLQPTYSCSNVS